MFDIPFHLQITDYQILKNVIRFLEFGIYCKCPRSPSKTAKNYSKHNKIEVNYERIYKYHHSEKNC